MVKPVNRFNSFIYVLNQEAGFSIANQFGHRAFVKRDNRGAAKHSFGYAQCQMAR